MSWRERWPFALGHWIKRRSNRHPAQRYGNPDKTSASVWRNWFFDDSSGLSGQGGQSSAGTGTVSGIAGAGVSGQGSQSAVGAGARGLKPPSTSAGRGRWPFVINSGRTWARRSIVQLSSSPWLWFGHRDGARAAVWRDWFDGGGSGLSSQGGQSSSGAGTVSGIAGAGVSGQGGQSAIGAGTVSGIAGAGVSGQGSQSAVGAGDALHYTGIVVTGGVQTGGVTTRVYLSFTGESWWTADHGGTVYAVAVDADGNVYTGGVRVSSVTTRKYGPDGTLLWTADHGATVRGIAVAADGTVYTVSATSTNSTRKYAADGTEDTTAPWPLNHGANVYAVAVDASGNLYTCGDQLSGSPYYTTRSYTSAGSLRWSHNHGGGAVSIAVISDGARIAVGGIAYSYTLDILTASSGAEEYRYTHEGVQVNGVAAGRTSIGNPDDTVVTASNRTASNLTVRELDYDIGVPGTTYNWSADHGAHLYSVAVDGHDGSTYVVGVRSGSVTTRKYDDTGAEITADAWPLDHGADVRAVAWSPYTPLLPALPPALPLRFALGIPDVREVVFAPALPVRWALGVPTVTPNAAPPDISALALQTVYRLYVTGGALLELPFAALQCQRRLGQSTWVTATIPTCSAALLADLTARQSSDGRLAVFAGVRLASGVEQMGEFMQAVITEIDGELEAGAGVITLRGRLVPTAFTAQDRILRGVYRRGRENDGRRFAESSADPLLRPNDTVHDGAATWTAGSILYRIEPTTGTMRVVEVAP